MAQLCRLPGVVEEHWGLVRPGSGPGSRWLAVGRWPVTRPSELYSISESPAGSDILTRSTPVATGAPLPQDMAFGALAFWSTL